LLVSETDQESWDALKIIERFANEQAWFEQLVRMM